MLFVIIPIAVIVGFLIAKYYKPRNKSEKIWASVLIPLISGVLIHLLVASCRNSGYGFAFDLGATVLFVAIPEVVLLSCFQIPCSRSGVMPGRRKIFQRSSLK